MVNASDRCPTNALAAPELDMKVLRDPKIPNREVSRAESRYMESACNLRCSLDVEGLRQVFRMAKHLPIEDILTAGRQRKPARAGNALRL